MSWNPSHLPDQTGRTHVVTGSTAGIGYFAAEQLAQAGAEVVLASRSAPKLERAARSIREQAPGARVSTVVLDLSSLESLRIAADELAARPRIDGLFLNGGAMNHVRGATTVDGLPVMFGTHAVSDAALSGLLLPGLAATGTASGRPARIVHASTGFVRSLRVLVGDVADRSGRRGFLAEYTHAKTVVELYAYELDRRLRAAGVPVESLVAHPGIGVDAKTPARPGVHDPRTQRRRNPFTPWAQGKDAAAWPAVRALTDPDAAGGDSYGPAGGRRGEPVRIARNPRTAEPDPELMERIWSQLHALAELPAAV